MSDDVDVGLLFEAKKLFSEAFSQKLKLGSRLYGVPLLFS